MQCTAVRLARMHACMHTTSWRSVYYFEVVEAHGRSAPRPIWPWERAHTPLYLEVPVASYCSYLEVVELSRWRPRPRARPPSGALLRQDYTSSPDGGLIHFFDKITLHLERFIDKIAINYT